MRDNHLHIAGVTITQLLKSTRARTNEFANFLGNLLGLPPHGSIGRIDVSINHLHSLSLEARCTSAEKNMAQSSGRGP